METGTTTTVDLTPIINNQKDMIIGQGAICILLMSILVFMAFDKVLGRFK